MNCHRSARSRERRPSRRGCGDSRNLLGCRIMGLALHLLEVIRRESETEYYVRQSDYCCIASVLTAPPFAVTLRLDY